MSSGTVTLMLVLAVLGGFTAGVRYERMGTEEYFRSTACPEGSWRETKCIISAPPVCYDRWHRVTVPTCDGGTQTLVESQAP